MWLLHFTMSSFWQGQGCVAPLDYEARTAVVTELYILFHRGLVLFQCELNRLDLAIDGGFSTLLKRVNEYATGCLDAVVLLLTGGYSRPDEMNAFFHCAETQFMPLCRGLLVLIDTRAIPDTVTAECTVLYHWLVGDYQSYIALTVAGCEHWDALNLALDAYDTGLQEAMRLLAVTHPMRLMLTISAAVFTYDVTGSAQQAYEIARPAHDAAKEACAADGAVISQGAMAQVQALEHVLHYWCRLPGGWRLAAGWSWRQMGLYTPPAPGSAMGAQAPGPPRMGRL